MLKALIAALAACAALSASAYAQTWSGPNPERRPSLIGQGDLDFALSELCFPYLLQEGAVEAIANRPSVRRAPNQEWANGDPTYYVGQADVLIAFQRNRVNSGRACTIFVRDGNEDRYRQTLDTRLAQWPAPLTRAAQQIPANNYVSREFRCSPAQGPQDSALISIGGENGMPSVMVTVSRSSDRDSRCDAPAAARASTVDPNSIVERFSAAAMACRSMIGGTPLDEAGAAAQINLSAPVRAADSNWATQSETGVVAFFGADARIRSHSEMKTGESALFLIAREDGAFCQVTALGAAPFAARLVRDLAARDRDWLRSDAGELTRSNGDRLRVESAGPNASGRSVIHLYFTRGAG